MATEKILNTRIQLKYDKYETWVEKNPTLKSGELAIAYLSTSHTTTSPDNGTHAVMFKVGPGAFNSLPWASALAADVYGWAKRSEAEFATNFLAMQDSNGETMQTKLDNLFVTPDELNTALSNLQTNVLTDLSNRVKAIEDDYLKNADKTKLEGKITAEETRAKGEEERIEGLVTAEASRADTEEKRLAGLITGNAEDIAEIIDAENGILAQAKADATNKADAAKSGAEATAAAALAEAKTALQKEIDDDVKVETDRATSAEQGLSNRIAALESGDASVAKQIENAVDALDSNATQAAGADGLALAIALENGKVTSISGSIAANTYDAYGSAAAVLGSTADTAGDATVHGALKAAAAAQADIDAFMAAADTGEAALDTLKEIQDFLNSDEGTVQTLIDKVSDNENAIADIVDGTTVVAKAQDAVNATNAENATNAQNAVNATNAQNAEKAADSDKLGGVVAADYALKTEAQGYATTAENNAKGYADTEISDAKTELIGTADDAATANTIAGAKKYADEAAASANAGALEDAKDYTDAREVEIKKYADQAEADAVASAKSYTDTRETAITSAYEAYADQAEVDAKAYADSLAGNYATAAQGAKADTAVQSVTTPADQGLKATRTDNDVVIEIDPDVVFVFNCGSATELVD